MHVVCMPNDMRFFFVCKWIWQCELTLPFDIVGQDKDLHMSAALKLLTLSAHDAKQADDKQHCWKKARQALILPAIIIFASLS